MIDNDALVGTWTKTSLDPCGRIYPDSLVFRENGNYVGSMANPGDFTLWDVGTYRVQDGGQVRISTANDAIVTYGMSLAEASVTFTAPDGCSIRYRRCGGASPP